MAEPTSSTVISAISLNQYFVDKSTGEALSGGSVYFYKDNDRTVPKLVYEQVQTGSNPATYTYEPLSDPMVLSGVGTFVDDNGNQVAVYFYPYDAEGNIEQYYITCYDSNGLLQFTREAWPPLSAIQGDIATSSIGINNQITNSQFVEVLFIPENGLDFSYSGTGTTSIEIAPGWALNVSYNGAGTISVAQLPIAGSDALPYNPPFTLGFVAGANLTGLTLTQVLSNNPNWAARQNNDATNGYINASVLISADTSITINYVQSAGSSPSVEILSATNTGSTYEQVNATVQLNAANNPDTGLDGYDTIELVLPTSGEFEISNVQVVSLPDNVTSINYAADTANRQRDYMAHYYKPLLAYKPIPSLLDAWDFALNPAQFLGSTVAATAIGANKSKYVWDQTIIFQSANSAISVSRGLDGADGALVLTADTPTQMAIIQYQPQMQARAILSTRLAVNVVLATTDAQTLTVSLWYTTDVSLPNLNTGTNNSLVATLGANGKPATFNGNWTEVPRSNLGDARFSTDGSGAYQTFNFSGWEELEGAQFTATYFAIVIGTNSVATPKAVVFKSVSLCAGDIATIPGPESDNSVLIDCEYYYEKSFNNDVVPANAVGLDTGEFYFSQNKAAATPGVLIGSVQMAPKYDIANVVFYNPVNNNSQAYNTATASDFGATTSATVGNKSFTGTAQGPLGSAIGNNCCVHWTADSRLGII